MPSEPFLEEVNFTEMDFESIGFLGREVTFDHERPLLYHLSYPERIERRNRTFDPRIKWSKYTPGKQHIMKQSLITLWRHTETLIRSLSGAIRRLSYRSPDESDTKVMGQYATFLRSKKSTDYF